MTDSDSDTENGYQTDNLQKKISAIPMAYYCDHHSDLPEGKPTKILSLETKQIEENLVTSGADV